MIKIGNTDLSTYGLYLHKNGHNGLFDFPSLKQEGTDWKDQDYIELSSRNIDYHYNSRTITLDCFVIASSWSDLNTKLNNIRTALIFDDLKCLSIPSVTNRGYMVYLSKTTLANPYRYFKNESCIADVKLIFEEPQPFNFQVYYNAALGTQAVSITISKGSKTLNTDSDKQRFITVWWNDTKTGVNLEQADFTLTTTVTSGIKQLIVTGEIDDIESITIDVNAKGKTEGAYYLRNGVIS